MTSKPCTSHYESGFGIWRVKVERATISMISLWLSIVYCAGYIGHCRTLHFLSLTNVTLKKWLGDHIAVHFIEQIVKKKSGMKQLHLTFLKSIFWAVWTVEGTNRRRWISSDNTGHIFGKIFHEIICWRIRSFGWYTCKTCFIGLRYSGLLPG